MENTTLTGRSNARDDLPNWARDILAAVPKRGDGLNTWLMRASIALRRAGRSAGEIIEALRCLTAGEPVKAGEIERAVRRSIEYVTGDGMTSRPAAPRWPEVDNAARAAIVAQHDGGALELWECSPVRFDDDSSHTEEIIDALFPGDPLICVADGPETAVTGPRESFRGRLGSKGLIVPSPMTKLTGVNQEGKESARCLDNTGPRRFLGCRARQRHPRRASGRDYAPGGAGAAGARCSQWREVSSFWFACGGQADKVVSRFFRYAVTLGADRATSTRCQLIRMPDGTRRRPDGTTARQSVLYWNPCSMEAAT